jgi:hypothetical protein
LLDPSLECRDALVRGVGPLDLAGDHHRSRRSAADHRTPRLFDRDSLEVRIQLLREDDERAAGVLRENPNGSDRGN